MLQSQKEAIAKNKESTVAAVVRLNEVWRSDHESQTQKITELPSDTLSKESLAERGIVVVDSPAAEVRFRDGAFREGELLDSHMKNGGSLTIILCDSPILLPSKFDAKIYDTVRPIINDILGSNRELSVSEVRENIRSYLESELGADPSRLAERIEFLQKTFDSISDDEISAWTLQPYGGRGHFQAQGSKPSLQDTSAILVAVGERPLELQMLKVINLPSTGQYAVSVETISLADDFPFMFPCPILAGDSYLQPAQLGYKVTKSKDDYRIDKSTSTAGVVLRHELGHYSKQMLAGGDAEKLRAVHNEGEIDTVAYESIQRAAALKESTGDDSLYYVVYTNKQNHFHVVT